MLDIKSHFALLLCVLALSSSSAQNNEAFQKIQGRLTAYSALRTPEKVYLHTDKDVYTNGETVWFKAYLVNGINHRPSAMSRVIYVDLFDGNDSLVAQKKLFAEFWGAPGDIEIPDTVVEGNFVLRAYTQYMLNEEPPIIFEKEFPVWVQKLPDARDIIDDGVISETNGLPTGYDDSEVGNLSGSSKKSSTNEKRRRRENSNSTESTSLLSDAPGAVGPASSFIIGKPIVSFYPEGGHLVYGMESILALKVTDSFGNGLALGGAITDQDGNFVQPINTFEFGLGLVPFRPKANYEYFANISVNGSEYKYALPDPMPKGFVLRVRNNGDHILLDVTTNIDGGLQGTMLLGHLRGDRFFQHIETDSEKNTYSIKLLTSELSDGVAHFTLFKKDGEPVCERLVFIENRENDNELILVTDKPNYGLREQVSLEVELQDVVGNPVQGEFSLSATTLNGSTDTPTDIRSWLLLNSDLGGSVENADYYFENDSQDRRNQLDALMLTHGWRRFVWKSFLTEKVSKNRNFEPEKGIMITGNTTDFDNRYQSKVTNATLSIIEPEIYQEKQKTNLQGKFGFGPLIFRDSIEAVINAELPDTKGKKAKNVSIYIDASTPILPFKRFERMQTTTKTVKEIREYLKTAYQKKVYDFKYDPKVTQLKEVVVTEKKKTREERINEELNSMTLYGSAQNRIFPDSITGAQAIGIFDIVARQPGVRLVGRFPNQDVIIRNARGGPLYVLDGMPVIVEAIQSLNPLNIMFIDVLMGPEAAIYGIRGGNGAIAIYTKTGLSFDDEQERYPGVTNFKMPGFYKAREFYSPDYGEPKTKHQKPDFRTTLYWHPTVKVGGTTKSKLDFFTGDSPGKYLIRLEGVTEAGKPVVGTHLFEVKENGY